MFQRVPFTGDEKTSLQVALQRHRDVVVWKIEGLDDDQLRRQMTPSGTSLLGMVKHPRGSRVRLVLRHLRARDRTDAVRRGRSGSGAAHHT